MGSKVIPLTMGVDNHLSLTPKELKNRVDVLCQTVSHHIPMFVESVERAVGAEKENRVVFLHQDSFAADMDGDEYIILGMAIKYAGLFGVGVCFVGRHRESLGVDNG